VNTKQHFLTGRKKSSGIKYGRDESRKQHVSVSVVIFINKKVQLLYRK